MKWDCATRKIFRCSDTQKKQPWASLTRHMVHGGFLHKQQLLHLAN